MGEYYSLNTYSEQMVVASWDRLMSVENQKVMSGRVGLKELVLQWGSFQFLIHTLYRNYGGPSSYHK